MSRIRSISTTEITEIDDRDFGEVCHAELDKLIKDGAVIMTFIAGYKVGRASTIKSVPDSPDVMFGQVIGAARQLDRDEDIA